jgi:hypothetical protein
VFVYYQVSRDSVLWRIVGGRFSGVKIPEAPKPRVNLGHPLKGTHEPISQPITSSMFNNSRGKCALEPQNS